MTATMAEINEEVAVNPDAQAAVTDFLDYTEYLPTDLIRSLTLIHKQDQTYIQNADYVDSLAQRYGELPNLPPNERPEASHLRFEISRHLDLALSARESAYAEASRLFDLADRHQDRLRSIIAKLNALPKPPSRDPTPQPQLQNSAKRSRTGRKLDASTLPRLTLKAPKGAIASGFLPRPRHRRVTVPGEVMPPYDPDEPLASTEVSDWDSEPPSPVKPAPKPRKDRSTADPDRKSREPREIATYRKPTPPPDDAPIGGKWRPWTRLSEYEMYKLRKKMKKNHTWEPSDVMIKRELAEKGRGWENYQKAKAAAQASGTPFLDIGNDAPKATTTIKLEVTKPGTKADVPSRPKSVKRSEPKKDKKPEPPKDPASLAAQEAELAARRLGDIGSAFRNLFSPFSSALASLKTATTPPITTPKTEKPPRKRKLEDPTSATPSTEPEPQPKKKQKLLPKPSPLAAPETAPAAPVSAGVIRIPPIKLNIAPQKASTSTDSTPLPTPRPPSSQRRPSTTAKSDATPPPTSRPSSRRSAAASVEPTIAASTRASRRSSVTPAAAALKAAHDTTPKTAYTAASRRPKREAPGTVTQSSQDGGAAVSISKRKHKPSNKVQTPKTTTDDKPEVRTDIDGNQEVIDPDEERYCICNDVSYGEMICCELEHNCTSGVWFHMECVDLHEMPARTVKWYCPGCRKKLRRGESTNGLVGRGIK